MVSVVSDASAGPDATLPEGEGWVPCEDATEMVERYEFDDLDLLAELTHPIRGRILRRMREPRTVAQLAELMDVPVTRLYHHVNRLLDLGLIQVVATRQVAAVTERCCQAVADTFAINPELFDRMDNREMSAALGALFDVAKLGFQREVEHGGFRAIEDNRHHSTLSLDELFLSPARRRELLERVRAISAEFESDLPPDHPDATRMTLFLAAFPETS